MTEVTIFSDWDKLPLPVRRQRVVDLHQACLQHEQVEVPMKEFFSDGCYGREVFIPKGTCLVGDIHIDEWITIVSRGKISVADEHGVRTIDATEHPVTFISPAGVKRAGVALEDTWWTMFRATPHTTSEAVREAHIVSDYKQLENRQNVICSNSDSGDSSCGRSGTISEGR